MEGDQKSGSWRQKLEVVDDLIGRGGDHSADALAFSALYVSWIGSGAIRCVEGGACLAPNRIPAAQQECREGGRAPLCEAIGRMNLFVMNESSLAWANALSR